MAERCIAVVDDEAPVRVALRRLLRLADYAVDTFSSGEEFLASLALRRPACVILDVHLPGVSGFDVQSRLRESGVEIPVVFITANGNAAITQSTAEASGTRLLRKPFSNDDLLAAIREALAR